jgi:hypothetical protein
LPAADDKAAATARACMTKGKGKIDQLIWFNTGANTGGASLEQCQSLPGEAALRAGAAFEPRLMAAVDGACGAAPVPAVCVVLM